MADEIDRANDKAQENLDVCLNAERNRNASLVCTGRCHNCDEPVPADHRFCDMACRDDYQLRHPDA